LAERQVELLPVPYFHVVFTLPAPAAEIAFQNKAVVYAILFKAAAEALRTIAADPRHLGAEIGFIGVLHTWGQNLQHHPHVHCLVPGGGVSPDGRRWIACRPGFFLPVRVLSRLFRRLFLENLKAAFEAGRLAFFGALAGLGAAPVFARRLGGLRRAEWVVYAKRPFAGPAAALAYLGRYTHRVAISNSRLIDLTGAQVRFRWRDYRHHDKSKVMTLAADEFIRRFLLHTLPDGFHRIRHYGFLGNRHRAEKIALCQELLAGGAAAPPDNADEPGQPALLKAGHIAVALDGTNEVDRDLALATFASQFPQVRLLVTSQAIPQSLAGDERWEVWELPEDIGRLRDGLLTLWLGVENGAKLSGRIVAEGLSRTIVSGYDLRLLADLAAIDTEHAALPTDRVALYRAMCWRAP
jgi:hypothetical protein